MLIKSLRIEFCRRRADYNPEGAGVSVNSPLGWPGGKHLLCGEIIKRFSSHRLYAEPFCGACWVLLAKPQLISRIEIINDANIELANFLRCARDKPETLVKRLRFRIPSQEDFEREKALRCAGDEVTRAARFFWLDKHAFSGRHVGDKRATFAYRLDESRDFQVIVGKIYEMHRRLLGVYILNEDFRAIIERVDTSHTLFYCDPPYYNVPSLYACSFTRRDHEDLALMLRNIKGKFVLSYDDTQDIREMYDWAVIEEVPMMYSMKKGGNITRCELIITKP